MISQWIFNYFIYWAHRLRRRLVQIKFG